MASVTMTAADVRPLPGAVVWRCDAAETITPGDLVYIDSSGDAALADADAAASAIVAGIVVSGPEGKSSFSAGDRVDVVLFGPVTGFSSLTPGVHLWASLTAGDIEAVAVTGSGDYNYVVGITLNATTILVRPFAYDIAAQSG